MQFNTFSIAAFLAVASAAATVPQRCRHIADPGNPANFANCFPGGGADGCHLEVPCKRVRINYGCPQGGHYIWFNYDVDHIPNGAIVDTEASCSDY